MKVGWYSTYCMYDYCNTTLSSNTEVIVYWGPGYCTVCWSRAPYLGSKVWVASDSDIYCRGNKEDNIIKTDTFDTFFGVIRHQRHQRNNGLGHNGTADITVIGTMDDHQHHSPQNIIDNHCHQDHPGQHGPHSHQDRHGRHGHHCHQGHLDITDLPVIRAIMRNIMDITVIMAIMDTTDLIFIGAIMRTSQRSQ